MKKYGNDLIILLVMIVLLILWKFFPGESGRHQDDSLNTKPAKCLIVASYNDNYEGQILKVDALKEGLAGKVEIKQFNMDSKNDSSAEACIEKAKEVKSVIEIWKPDIIVAVDDNASKYVVMPYLKDADIPVVFCGVDVNGKEYGYPYSNATGMVEVLPMRQLADQIHKILPDAKSAVCLRSDRISDEKDYYKYQELFSEYGIEVTDSPVKTFSEFKAEFINGQRSDFVILMNYAGIEGFSAQEAKGFVENEIKTLVVTQLRWMTDYAVFAVTHILEEQGEYAADLTMQILKGKNPKEIPIISNRKWDMYINETLSSKINVEIPEQIIQKAGKKTHSPGEQDDRKVKKCLFVGSYNLDYPFQYSLSNAVRTELDGKCKLTEFYLDSNRNHEPDAIIEKAYQAYQKVQEWEPDIIIASDDNASKYFVSKYLKNSIIPVVFCGVNWTADEYGYPYSNTTGMIEVAPLKQMISSISNIRSSFQNAVLLYPDNYTAGKTASRVLEVFKNENINIKPVVIRSMDQFEREFIASQGNDFVFLLNVTTINGWQKLRGLEIVNTHTKTLTVTFNEWVMPYAVFGITNKPSEQGEYAAHTALMILDGTNPSEIPIVANRQWNIYVNTSLMEQAGVKIPASILDKAKDISQ